MLRSQTHPGEATDGRGQRLPREYGEAIHLRSACVLFPPSGGNVQIHCQSVGPLPPEGTSWIGLVGDEASRPDESGWRGNASIISYDAESRLVTVRTALSGCPTLFLVRTDGWLGITTSPKLLGDVSPIRMRADPRGIMDLCTIGYPVNGRTLVRGVTVIPAGSRLALRRGRQPETTESWSPNPSRTFSDADEYARAQSECFADIMAALPVDDTLLSLSGGLDTRSILAGVLRRGEKVRCFTVSGTRTTLDAVRARDLCRAYGLSHTIVELGPSFVRDLWTLSSRASLLSGGLTSLMAAPQVYCYDQLGVGDSATVMLSGFLGNQVGRGATEGLTPRPTDVGILSAELTAGATSKESGPWYARGLIGNGQFDRRFLIQEENLYASIGAYAVGAARATQRSPYSDAKLLANAVFLPRPARTAAKRWTIDPRIPELKKRFFGTGEASFQRRYIVSVGGAVARQSINYGWTASGRMSPRGLALGARAFLEDVLDSASRHSRTAEAIYNASGLRGFSTHLQPAEWVRAMREPLMDELASESVRSSGLLDVPTARNMADNYFSGGSARPDTVIALTDVLLAHRNLGLALA